MGEVGPGLGGGDEGDDVERLALVDVEGEHVRVRSGLYVDLV